MEGEEKAFDAKKHISKPRIRLIPSRRYFQLTNVGFERIHLAADEDSKKKGGKNHLVVVLLNIHKSKKIFYKPIMKNLFRASIPYGGLLALFSAYFTVVCFLCNKRNNFQNFSFRFCIFDLIFQS